MGGRWWDVGWWDGEREVGLGLGGAARGGLARDLIRHALAFSKLASVATPDKHHRNISMRLAALAF